MMVNRFNFKKLNIILSCCFVFLNTAAASDKFYQFHLKRQDTNASKVHCRLEFYESSAASKLIHTEELITKEGKPSLTIYKSVSASKHPLYVTLRCSAHANVSVNYQYLPCDGVFRRDELSPDFPGLVFSSPIEVPMKWSLNSYLPGFWAEVNFERESDALGPWKRCTVHTFNH